jgi:ankyrin repeat protein
MQTIDAQLIAAVWHADAPTVQRLLADGADARARDPESGLTVLMIAAGAGQAEIVRALLAAGADVFASDSRAGASPLHKACQGGSLEVVKLLVEAGAFVNTVTPTTGHTPLIEAMWFKWPDIVAYLVERETRLSVATHYGFTLAQHYEYALSVNESGQDQLLAMGAAIERRQAADRQAVESQPLMAAVVEGSLPEVRRLLAAGAQVDERAPMLGGFNDMHTPLLVAARDGHTEIVAELLRAGADPNAMEPTFMAVPLHKAVYNGHAEITRLLTEQPGILLDVQGATNGYTALHDSLWHGYAECAEILVRAGARLDLLGHDGTRPLDLAIRELGADHPVTELIRARMAA